MRKTISILILGAACMNALAQTATNLLPNGDFSDAAQLSGWTHGVPGIMQFSTVDANGNSASGSMELIADPYLTTAISSCFAVASGTAFNIGGQTTGFGSVGLSFQGAQAELACSTYATANCTGNILDSPVSSLITSGEMSFAALPTISGTTDAKALSANCTAQVAEVAPATNDDTATAYFDNLFFNSQKPAPQPITLDGYMSGNWYDTAQSGQGFQLDFTDQQSILLAEWFTFAPDGKVPVWIYAQGAYDNTASTVTVPAAIYSGTFFPPNFRSVDVTQTLWGTLTFAFTDCDHGTVTWNSTVSGYGSGSMPITRLSGVRGTTCPR